MKIIRNRNVILLAIAVVLLGIFCSPKKAETPEDAFALFLEAYKTGDAEKVAQTLTPDSITSIEEYLDPIQEAYSKMGSEERAHKAFSTMAKQMGVPVNKIGSISATDYLGYLMQQEREGRGADTGIIPRGLLENPSITKKEENGEKAVLYFGDFGRIPLKKTDAGWRIQLSLNMEAPPSPQEMVSEPNS
ncbi:MAG: hypothetical protein KDK38_13660 [Leptospiraceae bacterium]|nr:hypothetical protein [Leptospiraceae bacterium]